MTKTMITPTETAKRLGPGEYRPDPTEAIQRAEDLPQAKRLHESRNYPYRTCPTCGRAAYRDRVFRRQLHDLGDLVSGRPCELELVYSQHYCSRCRKYFSVDVSDLAPPGGRYTHRVMALAVRSVVEDGLAYRPASWRLWRDHRVFVPFATIQNWVEAGGEKGD
jgi:transposase